MVTAYARMEKLVEDKVDPDKHFGKGSDAAKALKEAYDSKATMADYDEIEKILRESEK